MSGLFISEQRHSAGQAWADETNVCEYQEFNFDCNFQQSVRPPSCRIRLLHLVCFASPRQSKQVYPDIASSGVKRVGLVYEMRV